MAAFAVGGHEHRKGAQGIDSSCKLQRWGRDRVNVRGGGADKKLDSDGGD